MIAHAVALALTIAAPADANDENTYRALPGPRGGTVFTRKPSICVNPDADDLVRDFVAWQREVGPDKLACWDGDLTLYDGATREKQGPSVNWPYDFGDYKGLLCIQLKGDQLIQRNIFFYPPASEAFCKANGDPVAGEGGTCGVTGNGRIFEATQTIAGCDGSLAGPFVVDSEFGTTVFDTRTTVEGDDVVNYQVTLDGLPFQTQQTTVLPDGVRIRNALTLVPGTSIPSSLSFFVERKVTPLSEEAVREIYEANLEAYDIPNDGCQFDGVTGLPSETDCETFFFDVFFP